MIDRLDATLSLEAPVSTVRLVSPARARDLAKLDIVSVRDLVTNYPRRYIDLSKVETVAAARIGESCSIRAQVFEAVLKRPRRGLDLTEVTLNDGTGTLIVTAFKQPWLAKRLERGMSVVVSGKIEFNYGYKRMTNPFIEVLETDAAQIGMIIPIHPASGKVKPGMMRRLVANGLEAVQGQIDPLPLFLRAKYRLISRQGALNCIHFPSTMEDVRQARRRLVYEELLCLELALIGEGRRRSKGKTPTTHYVDGEKKKALEESLPFSLTGDQKKACDDVFAQMKADNPMNHMILGDVGTGKTVVAAFALAAAADSGSQALFMAPTEILAQQHAKSVGGLLDAAGISWGLLTGSTPALERNDLIERLESGEISVLIGTHALLEDDIRPAKCTLAIIDEQQRFGVAQRARLLSKGPCPDAMYLTATPIPRSLALALYGNLTLSYLREKPHEGSKRTTYVHAKKDRGIAYDDAKEALNRGERVFVVCPLVGDKAASEKGRKEDDGQEYEYDSISIEDDADMDRDNLAAAQSEAAMLQSTVFADYIVGLVHGKMPASEKNAVMEQFRSGEIQVLVATTVIEVGVDVPMATVMIVEDADRFGLAQLHQLRGRVGRGDLPGRIHLVSSTKSPAAIERLSAMEKTDDGFELAEYDLSLRREGDILGNRQHVASGLKLVNIMRDGKVIEAARQDAFAILDEDPELASPLYRALAREVHIDFGAASDISGG